MLLQTTLIKLCYYFSGSRFGSIRVTVSVKKSSLQVFSSGAEISLELQSHRACGGDGKTILVSVYCLVSHVDRTTLRNALLRKNRMAQSLLVERLCDFPPFSPNPILARPIEGLLYSAQRAGEDGAQ